jgi:hypothetical protein
MGEFSGRASLARCLLVLLTVTAGLAGLMDELMPDVSALASAIRSGAVAGEPFDEVLIRGCEAALVLCATWLWLAAVVVARDASRGRMSDHRGVPRVWRRLVLVACGVALVSGLGAPAHAGDEAGRSPVEGLPLPDRATTTTYVSQVFARASSHQNRPGPPLRRQAAVVVVRPGDTLWAISRADLPADADDDAVAVRVREIHQANRAVIGTDPDLIRPDQRLRMPRPKTIREEQR